MDAGQADIGRRPLPGSGRPGIDHSERIALAVAAGGHVVLFGLLSLAWLRSPLPPPPAATPIAVTLVDEVAVKAAAPRSTAAAASVAPEQGPPDEAVPAALPAPAKARPRPEPTAPAPAPRQPLPQAPAEPTRRPKSKPAATPESRPTPKPRSLPAPEAPAEHAKPVQTQAMSAARLTASARRSAALDALVARVGADPAAGSAPDHRARGSLLGADFEKGLTPQPNRSPHVAPPAAAMDGKAMADIASKIIEQVQPCANRQVKPGPGAERIRVTIRLRLNRDGSLAANPQVIAPASGVDDENSRYVGRVADNAIATFKGCSPLRGLPINLYDVTNGWSDFSLRYKLPG